MVLRLNYNDTSLTLRGLLFILVFRRWWSLGGSGGPSIGSDVDSAVALAFSRCLCPVMVYPFANRSPCVCVHVVSVWEFDSQLPHRMAPKLTEKHVHVGGLSAMNVKLAAQVFSQSVSSALCYLSVLKVLPSTGSNTADFCSLLNDLFESVNGRAIKHSDRPLLSAVTKTSPHLQLWKQFSEFIQSIEFQTEGKKINFPCLQGWLITLSAFRQMIPELLVSIPYIVMSRFTQDTLEIFFSVVRRQGGNNDHPTPSDFNCRMRLLMAQHIISTCGNANCEPDSDTVLIPVEVLTEMSDMTQKGSCSDADEVEQMMLCKDSLLKGNGDVDDSTPIESFDDELIHHENTASYIAGYVAKQALRKYNCQQCKALLLGDKVLSSSTVFLYFKEFDSVKEGLHFPSNSWLSTVCEFGRKFPSLFDVYHTGVNIKSNIVYNLNTISHDWLCCCEHSSQIWAYILNIYVKFMLFYKVKFLNATFRNRKKAIKKLNKLS